LSDATGVDISAQRPALTGPGYDYAARRGGLDLLVNWLRFLDLPFGVGGCVFVSERERGINFHFLRRMPA
jgi:hypothetical protein